MNDSIVNLAENKQQIPQRFRDTLADALNDPTINRTFGGKDGKLSMAQAGLVSAVLVKMLDKFIEQIEIAHARELALIAGFWKLYRTPLFIGASHKAAPKAEEAPVSSSAFRATVFTWGNLVGFAGIVLTCIACFYTRVYANYKERVQSQAEQIKELNDDKSKLKEVVSSYRSQLGDREQSLAQARQQVIDLTKEKETLSQGGQKFKVLSDKIAPIVEKLSGLTTNDALKKLPAAIEKLETEAASWAKKTTEIQGSAFLKSEYDKEAHERQQLQAQIDQLLMEKAHLSVNSTNH